MWHRFVVLYRRFGDNIYFPCSRVKLSKKNARSKWMHCHIGDGVVGFGFTGDVRELVRLLDRKFVSRTWENKSAQEEGETAE